MNGFSPQNGSEICHVGRFLSPFFSACVPLTESFHALRIIWLPPSSSFGYPLNSVWCPPQYDRHQFQSLQRISMNIGCNTCIVLPCQMSGICLLGHSHPGCPPISPRQLCFRRQVHNDDKGQNTK